MPTAYNWTTDGWTTGTYTVPVTATTGTYTVPTRDITIQDLMPAVDTAIMQNHLITIGDLDNRLELFSREFSKKIYKIITEHISLDISEEEFIQLLKEN